MRHEQYASEGAQRAAMLANRDQHDADIVELGRQYAVLLSSLDREGVRHRSAGYPNPSRSNAESSFLIQGLGRLRDKWEEDDEG